MRYHPMYKCPICGALQHAKAIELEGDDPVTACARMVKMQQFAVNPAFKIPPLNIPHKCGGVYVGAVGLMTFAGFLPEGHPTVR